MNTVPQVMISSTFFDLKQVRDDLANFLKNQLGCAPLVSEWLSFPIDPDVDTIENCRRRVEREADVLVLVIGGRYGYVDSSSSSSVTNIEYLAARAKGIPIYAFVERRVLAVLPVWRANREVAFSSVVDDPRVFEFIEQVRDVHRVWMREFDLAGEIIEALRMQFAYHALQGVQLIQRLKDARDNVLLRELRGVPLRIALEKPPGWEYKLLAETLTQELEGLRPLKEQMRVGIAYGPRESLSADSFRSWGHVRLAEVASLGTALSNLVDQELKIALGPEGDSGNPEQLVFVARSLAGIYQEALEWVLRVRRVVAEEDLRAVVRKMEGFLDDLIEDIESFGPLLLDRVAKIEEAVRKGEPGPAVSVFIRSELRGFDEFIEAAKSYWER